MSALSEHIQYDATADELIVHGRRVSVAAFQQAFFTHGRWVQVVEGPGDRITLRSVDSLPRSEQPEAISIRVKREMFRFESQQHWANKARSWFENCGVPKGRYIAVDAGGHVTHIGKCFMSATERGLYPVVVYELEPNWQPDPAQAVLNNAGGPA